MTYHIAMGKTSVRYKRGALLRPGTVRRALRNAHKKFKTWDAVSNVIGVNATTCSRMANSDYLPKDEMILLRLCLWRPRQHRDLLAYDKDELHWMIENREDF